MANLMHMIQASVGAFVVALSLMMLLVVIFAAMALYARNYIKVPPSEVAIFYGRKHTLIDEKGQKSTVGFRVVRGGAALLIPIV